MEISAVVALLGMGVLIGIGWKLDPKFGKLLIVVVLVILAVGLTAAREPIRTWMVPVV